MSTEPAAVSLITGASGFVGQHLVRELLRAGHTVAGGTLDGEPPRSQVLTSDECRKVDWLALDVTQADQLTTAIRQLQPTRVFHLAGQSSVGASFADVFGTWDVNATGTLRLLRSVAEACRNPVRFLLVSSAEVYGAVPEAEQPISEDRHPFPLSPYGASKAAAEMVALQASASEWLTVVVARSFNHTGPGQSTQFVLANWAEQLVRMGREGGEPVLRVGNLEAKRDMLDVRDVVHAYRTLLERGANGGIYNICTGRAYRLWDVVEELIELSGTGARIEVDAERLRPVDIPLLVGDLSRIRGLGWAPQIPLRQTLEDLLAAALPTHA